jgi:RNA methyltransferase, TrmH family
VDLDDEHPGALLASGDPPDLARLAADGGLVLLEGFHAVKHALRFGARIVAAVTTDRDGVEALATQLAPDIRTVLMSMVSVVSGQALRDAGLREPRTALLAFAARPAADVASMAVGARRDRQVVLLEHPRDLGNVGAVVRVAAAADLAAVLTTGSSDPWDPAALRGSAGLHYAVPVARTDTLPAGRPVVAVDPDGDLLSAAAIPPDAVLAFGTERHGLSDALLAQAAQRVRIPMRPGVSSLNLATAVAIVVYAAGTRAGP